jgi:predicted DNA-binding transcriptional regulator YafY
MKKRMSKQITIMREGGFLSVKESADRAGVNTATIYRMIETEKVQIARSGQQIFILATSLAEHYREATPIYNSILAGVGKTADPISSDNLASADAVS